MPEQSPLEDAVRSLLDADLRDEFDRRRGEYERDVAEASDRRDRVHESLLSGCHGRPVERLHAELEQEYAALLVYHRQWLVRRIRALLEAWALRFADDDA